MVVWNEVTDRMLSSRSIDVVGANRMLLVGRIEKEAKAKGNSLDMQTFSR